MKNALSTPETSRRGVLRLMGAGTIAASAAGLDLFAGAGATAAPASPSTPLPAAGDAHFWRQVRKQFVLDKKVLFMNVGTVGSPPQPVLDALAETNVRVAEKAESGYSSFDDTRALAASGLGCDLDEMALTHNTSDGMAKVLAGLSLGEGDEILTTNHEHAGGNAPMQQIRDRRGVVIRRVALPVGNDQRAEDYVELFRQAITSRTKVMVFSAPTYKTGTMLPIRLLAELAQEHGLITVVDGAHIPGMMNYSMRELGVDFLAGSAAKWQCGPGGTGLLYVRNKVDARYNGNPLPEFWPTISSSYPDGGLPPRTRTGTASYDIGRYLTSLGNGSIVLHAGTEAALTMWDRIGRQRIADHVLGLSALLKELIAERWGVDRLYSPKDDPRLVCALTGFNPFVDAGDVVDREKSNEFVSRVRQEHSIVIRNVDFPVIGSASNHWGVRVSTHLFHEEDDVKRVVEAMWKVSRAIG
ncbi:MAG: aminotransferase class V-fold PLP-dependent enzyme [Intrasporangium sp.]|uniref:aminotransferase class V-fold PLP-dependent enzyme n=1 Tax=Intrasporangium sp. TaxID=1925024 RepID=UPI003F820A96